MRLPTWVERLSWWLVFAGLPLILAGLGIEQFGRDRQAQEAEARRVRLRQALNSLESWKETHLFLESRLNRWFSRRRNSVATPEQHIRAFQTLRRTFPGPSVMTRFGEDGSPDPQLNEHRTSKTVLRELVARTGGRARMISTPEAGVGRRSMAAFLQTLLGPQVNLDQFRPGRVLPASYITQRRFVFLSPRLADYSHLLIHFDRAPGWHLFGLRRLMEKRNRHPDRVAVTLHRTRELTTQTPPGPRASLLARERRWAGRHLLRHPGEWVEFRGRLWSLRRLDTDFLLLGSIPWFDQPHDPMLSSLRRAWWLAAIMVFVLFLLNHYGLWQPAHRISTTVSGPFLFASGLALLVMAFLSIQFERIFRSGLEDGVFRSGEHLVRHIDWGFRLYLDECQGVFRETLAKPLPENSEAAEQEIVRRVNLLTRRFSIGHVQIVNEQGNYLTMHRAEGSEGVPWLRLGRSAFRNAFQQFSNWASPQSAHWQRKSPVFSVADAALRELLRNRNRLAQLNVAGQNAITMLSPIFDENRQVRFMVLVAWEHSILLGQYLRQESGREHRLRGNPFFFFARERHSHRLVLSPFLPNKAWIEPVFEAIRTQVEPIRRQVPWGMGYAYVVGMQGHEAIGFDLLTITSGESVLGAIRAGRQRLWFLGFVVLAIAGGLAQVLGRTLVQPLGDLSAGLERLRRRDFRFQIPVRGTDELEGMTKAFNTMVVSLQDLELARTLQESLFPAIHRRHGMWDIAGSSEGAIHVGGDYFDFLPIDGERLLVVLADAAGQGVASALMVSMTKGYLLAAAPGVEHYEQLIEGLNRAFTQMSRRTMMSCQLVILDRCSQEVVLINAGHPYPFHVSAGRAVEIAMPAFPLGLRAHARFPVQHRQLQPGDFLALATDGFFEVRRPDGSVLGYERWRALVAANSSFDGQATHDSIKAAHRRDSASETRDDDQTLVILQLPPNPDRKERM
jgi:HAMP domain-containing protein